MMKVAEISRKTGLHFTTIFYWISGKHSPRPEKAAKTGIHKKAWDYPEDFFNPLIPYKYKRTYPPDLSHLSGEALDWARQIIAAFPDRPPTKEEFKAWKRKQQRKKAEAVHG